MQQLIDRLATVLGEHMADGDERHVSFHAMQDGSQPHQLQPPEQWTELSFEYSALVVLRARGVSG